MNDRFAFYEKIPDHYAGTYPSVTVHHKGDAHQKDSFERELKKLVEKYFGLVNKALQTLDVKPL